MYIVFQIFPSQYFGIIMVAMFVGYQNIHRLPPTQSLLYDIFTSSIIIEYDWKILGFDQKPAMKKINQPHIFVLNRTIERRRLFNLHSQSFGTTFPIDSSRNNSSRITSSLAAWVKSPQTNMSHRHSITWYSYRRRGASFHPYHHGFPGEESMRYFPKIFESFLQPGGDKIG